MSRHPREPLSTDLACDVLVVGGGPTGATLGLLLARQGVSTLVIDREADIYPLPRAAHIDHETVRIFQALGLAETIVAASRRPSRYDFLSACGEILLRFEGTDRLGPGGWPAANMIHQPSLEAALRGAIGRQRDVDLRTLCAFRSFDRVGDGVVTAVDTPDGPQTIRSRFLVGADGARSPVRAAAGIGLDDLRFDEPWLVIDAIVHDPARLPDANLQICDPARPTTCVLMGEGRHRWEFMIKPDETPEQVSDDAFVAGLLAPWNVEGAVSLERKAVYRFNARIARQWRKGPVVLAGDAAHQMPPFAGQGLCSGLRDAANLAWKLAARLRGTPDALLDAYQPEREPNVRGIVDMAIMMGRTVCLTDPEAARVRDRQMLAARAAGSAPDGAVRYPGIGDGCIAKGTPGAGTYFPQPVVESTGQRLDDALGAGAWLIGRTVVPAAQADDTALRIIALDAATLAPFRAAVADWLAKLSADAVLVRPDRYVFGTGSAASLLAAWHRWTG